MGASADGEDWQGDAGACVLGKRGGDWAKMRRSPKCPACSRRPGASRPLPFWKLCRLNASPSLCRYCMIPFAKAICPVLDLKSRTLEVAPPEGLLDMASAVPLKKVGKGRGACAGGRLYCGGGAGW